MGKKPPSLSIAFTTVRFVGVLAGKVAMEGYHSHLLASPLPLDCGPAAVDCGASHPDLENVTLPSSKTMARKLKRRKAKARLQLQVTDAMQSFIGSDDLDLQSRLKAVEAALVIQRQYRVHSLSLLERHRRSYGCSLSSSQLKDIKVKRNQAVHCFPFKIDSPARASLDDRVQALLVGIESPICIEIDEQALASKSATS